MTKISDLDTFTKNFNSTYSQFIHDSSYAQSCEKDMPEEESIVATFMKYWGEDHDRAK